VLKALCAGFFMQTARMCGAGGGWLTIGDSLLVQVDGSSVLASSTSEWLMYTELVGNTVSHCMMRTVSAVEYAWLKPFLPKLADIDMKRLIQEGQPRKSLGNARGWMKRQRERKKRQKSKAQESDIS